LLAQNFGSGCVKGTSTTGCRLWQTLTKISPGDSSQEGGKLAEEAPERRGREDTELCHPPYHRLTSPVWSMALRCNVF